MKAAKPKRRKTVQDLLKSKRRDQRKKGQRLAKRALTETVVRQLSHQRTYSNIVMVRRPETPTAGGELLLGVRTGLFGHPTTTVLKIQDEKVVGAVEDTKELGEIVTQLGLLTLGALLNYNLAMGPDGLAKALARWANIDLSELEKKAEEEALEAVKAGIELQKSDLDPVDQPELQDLVATRAAPTEEESETPTADVEP